MTGLPTIVVGGDDWILGPVMSSPAFRLLLVDPVGMKPDPVPPSMVMTEDPKLVVTLPEAVTEI